MSLRTVVEHDRTIRAIGFDDAPFDKETDRRVHVAGVVCAGVRFEGMVWTHVRRDGWNATQRVIDILRDGKFLPQLHLVLLDGIAFGGFNIVDLPRLAGELDIPCATVMRRRPDMVAIEGALQHLTRSDERLQRIEAAGPVHRASSAYFQVVGEEPEVVAAGIDRLTDNGHIPEPIRIAHMIGAAVKTGESGRRA